MNVYTLIFLTIGIMFIATKKGFNPWLWLLAGTPLGLVVIAFLPSANPKKSDAATCEARRKKGNVAGVILSALSLTFGIYLFVLLRS